MARGTLEVLLIDAQGNKDKNIFAKIHPYVMIQYGNQEHKSCVAKGEGKKQVWNETFLFEAKYPGGEDHKYKLTLRILDSQRHHEDVFVGETTIYLEDVISLGVDTGKAELRRAKYRIVLPDESYAGEIEVAASFTPN